MNKLLIITMTLAVIATLANGVSMGVYVHGATKIKDESVAKFVIDRDPDILVKVETIRYNEFRIIATRGKIK